MVSEFKKNQKTVEIPCREFVDNERRRIQNAREFRKALSSTIGVLLNVAACAVLLVSLFLPVLQVMGTSMEPTLQHGDVIVLLKTGQFDTGDLCAVRVDGNILIKRMIAGPGDWVNIDEEGNVYVNSQLLDEPYISEKSLGPNDTEYPYQVPDNSLFVLGDHRSISVDSRRSEVGCIPYEKVVGRIIIRIWPLNGFQLL